MPYSKIIILPVNNILVLYINLMLLRYYLFPYSPIFNMNLPAQAAADSAIPK
jgi:hypothetical protein